RERCFLVAVAALLCSCCCWSSMREAFLLWVWRSLIVAGARSDSQQRFLYRRSGANWQIMCPAACSAVQQHALLVVQHCVLVFGSRVFPVGLYCPSLVSGGPAVSSRFFIDIS